MRWAVLAAMLGGLGCGKRINPAWCQQPENQSVSECGNIADAKSQSMACQDDQFCAMSSSDKPFCDVTDGVCVQCLLPTQCGIALPACTGGVCSACTQNSDCSATTDFCDEGICAQPSDAVIVSPMGTGTVCGIDPADPTHRVQPCDLVTGANKAILEGKILRLVPDSSGKTFTPNTTLVLAGNIRVTGEGTVIDGGLAHPTIQISSGQATFGNLELRNMSGTAIACVGGSLTAKRLYIHESKSGIADAALTSMPGCTLELDESVFYKDAHGAVSVASAEERPFFIHNSVFASNGGGPAIALNGPGRFEYNTVVENRAPTNTGGVTCTGGPSLDMNILSNNDVDQGPTVAPPKAPDAGMPPPPPPPQQVGCDMGIAHGFTGYKVEFVFLWEIPGTSYTPFSAWHLTQASPDDVVNIPNVVCNNPMAPVHDIDDTLRPAHQRCDMGADECTDCSQTQPGNGEGH